MENQVFGLFDEALQKLHQANEELNRPSEDVVSYLVCKNSQVAIENFLKGFLLKNNVDPKDLRTIKSLYQKCLAMDDKFRELDLSGFTCRSQGSGSRSCSGTSKVSKCYQIAGNMNAFFRREKLLD